MMASSSAIVDDVASISSRDKIIAALTCPVCLDLCTNPTILPQCGHSLCSACLEQIYKKSETAGSKSVTITTFLCPECRAENSVPNGELDKLKINYPILRVVEVIRNEHEAAMKDGGKIPGEFCQHISSLAKSTCLHCDLKFCKSCLFNHMELLKIEMNFVSSGFHSRFDQANSRLGEKADEINKKIDENVRKVQEEIATSGETLIEALRHAVLENCHRLSEKAHKFGGDLRSRLASEIKTSAEVSDQQADIDRRLKQINETSILFNTGDSFAKIHQFVFDQDFKISNLERIDQCEVARSDISFHSESSLIATLTDLLAKTADVAMAMKDPENDKCQGKMADAYKELHIAAKSGDLKQMKAIFERTLSTCHQFIVEHRDKNDKERTILLQAASSCSLDMVRYLVAEKGADVLARDNIGNLAIHLAVAGENRTELVKFLLETNGEVVNAMNNEKWGPLHFACALGNFELAQFLVDEMKANIEQAGGGHGGSPLLHAAQNGHLDIVKLLVERGANLYSTDEKYGSMAVHIASHFGHTEIVKFLLEQNPDLLERQSLHKNRTTLCFAVQTGQVKVAEFLLNEKQSNVEHVDSDGNTPLLLAVGYSQLEMVKLLLENGANLCAKSCINERTIIHQACGTDCVDMVRYLLDHYPDMLEMKDNGAGTGLFYAVAAGKLEVVKCLVEQYGANVCARDEAGITPLFEAIDSSEAGLPFVKYLLEHGASITDRDEDCKNALHRVLSQPKNAELITYLVDLRPDLLSQADKNGKTPLQAAERCSDLPDDILKMMRQRANLGAQ